MSPAFDLLCLADPRLEDLRRSCEEAYMSTGQNLDAAREIWYGCMSEPGLKFRMSRLVGSFAEVPELADRGAYTVAYRGLWKELTGHDL